MDNAAIIKELNSTFALALVPSVTEAELEQVLAKEINHLIEKDFNRLVHILYRVDVNEQKLKQLLKDNPDTDAGLLIARLMIERQKQKLKTREEFKRGDVEDEDEW